MDITYIGHSCFRIKTKTSAVVTDPYDSSVGFALPTLTADIVTVSHAHPDHNNSKVVHGTSARPHPFVIEAPGEYEIGGVSVFGYPSYHDAVEGAERGPNIVYAIVAEEITVLHLGDLGHLPSQSLVEDIGPIDVLLCPVGGVYTLDPANLDKILSTFEPSYFVPMHYLTPAHNQNTYGSLATLETTLKRFGVSPQPQAKLSVTRSSMPEELQVVTFG